MFHRITLQLLYYSAGIIANEKLKKYETYLFALLILNDIILNCCMVIAVFQSKQLITKIEIFVILIGMLTLFAIRICLKVNREKLLRISKNLYTKDIVSCDMTFPVTRTFPRHLTFLLIFSYSLMFALPMLYAITRRNINYNDPMLYLFRNLFMFYDANTFSHFVLTWTLQGLIVMPNFILLMTVTIFVNFTIINLQTRIDEMSIRFAEDIETYLMRKEASEMEAPCKIMRKASKLRQRGMVYDILFKENFHKLIELQQDFYRYLADFARFMSLIICPQIIWFIIVNVLLFFSIIQIHGDGFIRMRIIAAIVNHFVLFYGYCYIGEMVNHLDKAMSAVFYNARWYDLTPTLRRTLITVNILSQRRFYVKVFGMYTINLYLYGKSIKTVYSIVNLLIGHRK